MKELHLICNSHIDPCWQWDLDEGIACTLSTFRCAADFCEEYDTLIFNHNEALLYEYVEKYDPSLFQRIQKLVRQGKWHIMGGWYLQPDCNLPGGESFVRQIITGRKYFSEKFGARPTTAMNVDSFGHTRGLVQILKKSGYDSYFFCRPFQKDMYFEKDDFIWEGYDGSQIRGFRSFGIYNSLYGMAAAKVEEWLGKFSDKSIGCVLWGVGDHGGGPSRVDLNNISVLQEKYKNEVNILHSTPEVYFAKIAQSDESFPVWKKGLNHWGPGCYSAMVRIKQGHRKLESLYLCTEKMAIHAALSKDMPFPVSDFEKALKALMFVQFHDILPGSAIPKVEETGLRKIDYGLDILNDIRSQCFFKLCEGQPKARPDEIPVLIYNPHPFEIEDVFECEFMLANMNVSGTFMNPVVYQNGQPLPSQCEKEDSNFPMDWRKKVTFKARLLPGCINRFDCLLETLESDISKKGINVQTLADSFLKPDSCRQFESVETFHMPFGKPEIQLKESEGYLYFQCPHYNAAINCTTGLLDDLTIINTKAIQILKANALQPVVIDDTVDSWAAQDKSFTRIQGYFKLATPAQAAKMAGVHGTLPPVRVIEDGDVRTVIEASMVYGNSQLLITYKLTKDSLKIEIQMRVIWSEKDAMLKIALPHTIESNTCMHQTSYGTENTPNSEAELYMQQWCGVFDDQKALAVLNDGLYSFSSQDYMLYLTLLRSPAYAAHPSPAPNILCPLDYQAIPRMDQGYREFTFWLIGAESDTLRKNIDKLALAVNEKPYVLSFFPDGKTTSCTSSDAETSYDSSNTEASCDSSNTEASRGASDTAASYRSSDTDTLYRFSEDVAAIVTAFKHAENDDAFILRVFEPLDVSETVKIDIPLLNISHTFKIGPYEIMSFRCTYNHIEPCSLTEEAL